MLASLRGLAPLPSNMLAATSKTNITKMAARATRGRSAEVRTSEEELGDVWGKGMDR
jgi:hypothetical protein